MQFRAQSPSLPSSIPAARASYTGNLSAASTYFTPRGEEKIRNSGDSSHIARPCEMDVCARACRHWQATRRCSDATSIATVVSEDTVIMCNTRSNASSIDNFLVSILISGAQAKRILDSSTTGVLCHMNIETHLWRFLRPSGTRDQPGR